MSGITSHVLDTALGRPARDIPVRLDVRSPDGTWTTLSDKATNEDGRVTVLVLTPKAGTYRLTFETGAYLEETHGSSFYPWVEVTFEIDAPDEHHHVPLLLSPYGYSTYRGS